MKLYRSTLFSNTEVIIIGEIKEVEIDDYNYIRGKIIYEYGPKQWYLDTEEFWSVNNWKEINIKDLPTDIQLEIFNNL